MRTKKVSAINLILVSAVFLILIISFVGMVSAAWWNPFSWGDDNDDATQPPAGAAPLSNYNSCMIPGEYNDDDWNIHIKREIDCDGVALPDTCEGTMVKEYNVLDSDGDTHIDDGYYKYYTCPAGEVCNDGRCIAGIEGALDGMAELTNYNSCSIPSGQDDNWGIHVKRKIVCDGQTIWDTCEGTMVEEYNVLDSDRDGNRDDGHYKYFTCPTGQICSNGACIINPVVGAQSGMALFSHNGCSTPSEYDDDQWNRYTKRKIICNGEIVSDSCHATNGKVKEYNVLDLDLDGNVNDGHYKYYTCPDGQICGRGVCVSEYVEGFLLGMGSLTNYNGCSIPAGQDDDWGIHVKRKIVCDGQTIWDTCEGTMVEEYNVLDSDGDSHIDDGHYKYFTCPDGQICSDGACVTSAIEGALDGMAELTNYNGCSIPAGQDDDWGIHVKREIVCDGQTIWDTCEGTMVKEYNVLDSDRDSHIDDGHYKYFTCPTGQSCNDGRCITGTSEEGESSGLFGFIGDTWSTVTGALGDVVDAIFSTEETQDTEPAIETSGSEPPATETQDSTPPADDGEISPEVVETLDTDPPSINAGETPSTCDENQRILRLSDTSNAHAEKYDGTTYGIEICYDEIFPTPYIGTPARTCDDPGYSEGKIIELSDVATNAHANIPEGMGSNYDFRVCYGDLICHGTENECGGEAKEILSLSDSINAHLGIAEKYDMKICCTPQSGGGPPGSCDPADCDGRGCNAAGTACNPPVPEICDPADCDGRGCNAAGTACNPPCPSECSDSCDPITGDCIEGCDLARCPGGCRENGDCVCYLDECPDVCNPDGSCEEVVPGVDSDGDGILDDGNYDGDTSDPCQPCINVVGECIPRTQNCDDNCIIVPNANQIDSDNNGIGELCELDPPTTDIDCNYGFTDDICEVGEDAESCLCGDCLALHSEFCSEGLICDVPSLAEDSCSSCNIVDYIAPFDGEGCFPTTNCQIGERRCEIIDTSNIALLLGEEVDYLHCQDMEICTRANIPPTSISESDDFNIETFDFATIVTELHCSGGTSNDICEVGEGCVCSDCFNRQANCVDEFVCAFNTDLFGDDPGIELQGCIACPPDWSFVEDKSDARMGECVEDGSIYEGLGCEGDQRLCLIGEGIEDCALPEDCIGGEVYNDNDDVCEWTPLDHPDSANRGLRESCIDDACFDKKSTCTQGFICNPAGSPEKVCQACPAGETTSTSDEGCAVITLCPNGERPCEVGCSVDGVCPEDEEPDCLVNNVCAIEESCSCSDCWGLSTGNCIEPAVCYYPQSPAEEADLDLQVCVNCEAPFQFSSATYSCECILPNILNQAGECVDQGDPVEVLAYWAESDEARYVANAEVDVSSLNPFIKVEPSIWGGQAVKFIFYEDDGIAGSTELQSGQITDFMLGDGSYFEEFVITQEFKEEADGAGITLADGGPEIFFTIMDAEEEGFEIARSEIIHLKNEPTPGGLTCETLDGDEAACLACDENGNHAVGSASFNPSIRFYDDFVEDGHAECEDTVPSGNPLCSEAVINCNCGWDITGTAGLCEFLFSTTQLCPAGADCGNNIIDEGEQCGEPGMLGGTGRSAIPSCEELGYESGTEDCVGCLLEYDCVGLETGECGDNEINQGEGYVEQCDGERTPKVDIGGGVMECSYFYIEDPEDDTMCIFNTAGGCELAGWTYIGDEEGALGCFDNKNLGGSCTIDTGQCDPVVEEGANCNADNICDTNEDCTCGDCWGEQDGCTGPGQADQICGPFESSCENCLALAVFDSATGTCKDPDLFDPDEGCPRGTSLCGQDGDTDRECRSSCGDNFQCNENEICEEGEGCDCLLDCFEKPASSCEDGLICTDSLVCGTQDDMNSHDPDPELGHTSGSCTSRVETTTGDCSTDSSVTLSHEGVWTLGPEGIPDLGTQEEVAMNRCTDGGSQTILCPASVRLPFFNGFSAIASLMLLSLVYMIMNCKIKRRVIDEDKIN